MLDDPERTSRLLAALKAALPFEVHLTPPLARLLREQQVVLPAGDRQTVSAVSYLGDAGGIVCHIVTPDGGEVARVPDPRPGAAVDAAGGGGAPLPEAPGQEAQAAGQG